MNDKEKMPDAELNDPDHSVAEEAYRSLPRFGGVTVVIPYERLPDTLQMLENTGFCGLQVARFNATPEAICKIRAYKGKVGPCFDTGCTATYTGAAMAVLDDDNHLIIADKAMAVCEKTAGIYRLPSYRNTIIIQQPPSDESGPFDDPKPFDCDDFEKTQEQLYNQLEGITPEPERIPLFYPGPFRKLILTDGTIVHRGMVNMIPKSQSGSLVQKDRFFPIDSQPPTNLAYFQTAYRESGSRCLLLPPEVEFQISKSSTPDFNSLSSLQPDFRNKLRAVISNEKRYFILTGSDPQDHLGCCPSLHVGEANRLVRSGILSAYKQPGPADTCPVTTYAFNGELEILDGRLQMTIDRDLRKQVVETIDGGPSSNRRNVLKWSLLSFVLVTTLIAIAQLFVGPEKTGPRSLFDLLSPDKEDGLMILLFHNEKRCSQCLNMEQYINDFIAAYPTDTISGKALTLRMINMNDKQYTSLVNRFRIYISTPVLIEFGSGKTVNTRVLHDAWKLYLSPGAFKDMLVKEMAAFTAENHE